MPPQWSAARIATIAAAHDEAVAAADPSDVGGGGTSLRVWDFVNRGAVFDEIYLLVPVLAACRLVIGAQFKLSTMHSRAIKPHVRADTLHVDFAREATDAARGAWPMLGFIVMLDDFTAANGATRFVPCSQHAAERPPCGEPVPACGPAGSVIVYNGSVWHGHGANTTDRPRRSIQGAYIRRDAVGFAIAARMRPETLDRIGPLARQLLAV
ncbi:MAG TPA: phytanoyl-CoA dioxygenase family protein [Gammaproteobacteria bacterium]|nr:phytanoyl-CoA dioxygenase family protein [Gammaproteobacteria bacterium]